MAELLGLLDHFRPPLYPRRGWESLHAYWASELGGWLNANVLPRRYFAEVQMHVGSRFDLDVGTFEWEDEESSEAIEGGGGTALAVSPRTWLAPAPTAELPAIFPDSMEILIYADEGDAILAAAVELVSPGNKDRPSAREAFASKCASYLQQGVGLVIVDIVTNRHANLHNELACRLGGDCLMNEGVGLYTSAYRPVRRADDEHHDVWFAELALGQPLPIMPLGLRRGPTVPLDLGAPYVAACSRARIR